MEKTYTIKKIIQEVKQKNLTQELEVYQFFKNKGLININITDNINKVMKELNKMELKK